MPANSADDPLLEDMKQRELQLKRKQRAIDAIQFEQRRYRGALTVGVGLAVAAVAAALLFGVFRGVLDRVGWWLPSLIAVALCLVVGMQAARRWLRSPRGRALLAKNSIKARARHEADLNAGYRWLEFYYGGEEISAHVPQVLYFLEADQRFDSVDDALDFAKQSRSENALVAAHALKNFELVAAATNLAVVSTIDKRGAPSSRIMSFVRSSQPGVWYVTTPPNSRKAGEFDRGKVALVTLPTQSGASISSNRVVSTRSALPLSAIEGLVREQIPGYLDIMSQEERDRELVYELRLLSARVNTWLDRGVVDFDRGEATGR